jgi:hypothetical protein
MAVDSWFESEQELGGLEAADVVGGQVGVGFGDGVGKVYGAGGVFDDSDVEAEMLAVDGGVADAEVVGEAAEEEALQAALAEVASEAGGGEMVVLEEGGVGVDVGAETFSEDELGLRDFERGVEICAGRVLEAVIGPEGLGDLFGAVAGFDGFEGLLVMGGGEGDVTFGMPVLGEDDVGETGGEGVDGGNDGVAVGDGEGSACSIDWRAEIVLEVDDEEDVVGLKGEIHGCNPILRFFGGPPYGPGINPLPLMI